MRYRKYHAKQRRILISKMGDTVPVNIGYVALANKLFDEYPVLGDRPRNKEYAAFVISDFVNRKVLYAPTA